MPFVSPKKKKQKKKVKKKKKKKWVGYIKNTLARVK